LLTRLPKICPLFALTTSTSTERANSHAKLQLLLAHPLVRNGSSVRNLNPLTCMLINLKALQRAKSINASLLPMIPLRN